MCPVSCPSIDKKRIRRLSRIILFFFLSLSLANFLRACLSVPYLTLRMRTSHTVRAAIGRSPTNQSKSTRQRPPY